MLAARSVWNLTSSRQCSRHWRRFTNECSQRRRGHGNYQRHNSLQGTSHAIEIDSKIIVHLVDGTYELFRYEEVRQEVRGKETGNQRSDPIARQERFCILSISG